MEPESAFELVLARPAVRTIQSVLPEAVATAVVEFVTGPLVDNPHRVGKAGYIAPVAAPFELSIE